MNNKFVQQWSISVYDCEKLCIYRNIKVEFCHEKNVVENEYHFVLVCPAYRSVRTHFLPTYYCSWPNKYKLEHLLKAANKNLTIKLYNYLTAAWKIRCHIIS